MKKQLSYIGILLATVLLALYVSVFHFQLLMIHGKSMEPTYKSGSIVLLEKRPAAYRRGDIVLCRCDSVGRSLVKRIAAGPGDELYAVGDMLYINGAEAAPLPEKAQRSDCIGEAVFVVPEGKFFLLGDNVEHSIDSRYAGIGLVTGNDLHGRIFTGSR